MKMQNCFFQFRMINYLFISKDVLSDTDISDLQKKFIPMSEFSKFKAYTFYIQKFTIKNSLNEDKILSISQGENHFKSEFLLKFKDRDESFVNSAGYNFNDLSTINPYTDSFEKANLRNLTFTLKVAIMWMCIINFLCHTVLCFPIVCKFIN